MKTNGHATWTLDQWHAPACPDGVSKELEHRVAFLGRQEDYECVMLAKFGMTHDTIASFTGLSKGQVGYRLKKAGVKVTDFRMGIGAYAQIVMQHTAARAAKLLVHELRQLENKP